MLADVPSHTGYVTVTPDITIAGPIVYGALSRKLLNLRAASLRNKLHAESLPHSSLNNDATALMPTPKPSSKRKEVKIARGIELWGTDKIIEACAKELRKNFVTYKSLGLTTTSQLEPGALFVRGQILVKQKSTGAISARLPLGGDRQTPDTYGGTYAGTSNTTNRLFLLNVARKDAADRNMLDQLIVADTDLPGAFLHNGLPRSMTGGRQLYTRLPKDLPDIPHHLLYSPAVGDNLPPDPDVPRSIDSGGWSPEFRAAQRIVDPELAWTLIPHINDDIRYASRIAEVLGLRLRAQAEQREF